MLEDGEPGDWGTFRLVMRKLFFFYVRANSEEIKIFELHFILFFIVFIYFFF